MASPKFDLGHLLKAKDPIHADAAAEARPADSDASVATVPSEAAGHAIESRPTIATENQPRDPLEPAIAPDSVSRPEPTESERRKPGPKGRGRYVRRSIDLAPDLDAFIESARRSHVRPDGVPSLIYTHFVEDLIAAERARRASP